MNGTITHHEKASRRMRAAENCPAKVVIGAVGVVDGHPIERRVGGAVGVVPIGAGPTQHVPIVAFIQGAVVGRSAPQVKPRLQRFLAGKICFCRAIQDFLERDFAAGVRYAVHIRRPPAAARRVVAVLLVVDGAIVSTGIRTRWHLAGTGCDLLIGARVAGVVGACLADLYLDGFIGVVFGLEQRRIFDQGIGAAATRRAIVRGNGGAVHAGQHLILGGAARRKAPGHIVNHRLIEVGKQIKQPATGLLRAVASVGIARPVISPAARGIELLCVEMVHRRQPDLFQVVLALRTTARFPRRLNGRQQQSNQNANDGNDYQQFDKRETDGSPNRNGSHENSSMQRGTFKTATLTPPHTAPTR